MGDRLATIDMGRKLGTGCCVPFGDRELGPHLTMWPVKAYLRTKWQLDPFSRLATTDMGRKVEAAVPLFGWG